MTDVSVSTNNLVYHSTGEPLTVAPTSESSILASVPDVSTSRRIPLTDETGRLAGSHVPEYLTEDNVVPPVSLTILFDNNLA